MACNAVFDAADTIDFFTASETEVAPLALQCSAGKGEAMGCGFAWDSEIVAGFLPFRTVGVDFRATGAFVGDEVGEFVAQGALDFIGGNFVQTRVEFDQGTGPKSATGAGSHAGIPRNDDAGGENGEF